MQQGETNAPTETERVTQTKGNGVAIRLASYLKQNRFGIFFRRVIPPDRPESSHRQSPGGAESCAAL
jgi:hypothetical protein